MSIPLSRRTIRLALTLAISVAVSIGVLWGTFISSAFENDDSLGIVPTISATKVDALFTDVDGDGRADPGDTLQYTVTINNTGPDPALNTIFTDTLPNSLTLVAGSVNASPIASNDSYTATGNVRITIPVGSGVLANDVDPNTGTNAGLTASAGATSVNGGNVTMSANGSFVYNPAPGFEGTDTFTYTVTDTGGATGTGTVTFNVSGMIWFVNASAAGGGDGRLSSPFNCLVGAGCFDPVAADGTSDNIFLFSGSYTGGVTLLAGQRLIGQGATASLSTITGLTPPTGSDALPATGGSRPAITTTAASTNGVNAASGNTLRGFNIGNTTGIDIAGASVGTLAISEMDLSGTGRLLDLASGTITATFDSLVATSAPGGPGINLSTIGGTLTVSTTTSISGAGTQGISISSSAVAANFGTSTTIGATTQGILVGTSTGNISFGNTAITGGTDGVSLQNNSAGTRSFGTLSTTNGSGTGFVHAVGGGLTTVNGTATFTNPAVNCINIQDSTTAVTFQNVTATQCGAIGVFLDDNTGSVSFLDLDISPDANIRAFFATDQSVGAITTTSGTIPSTGTATAVQVVGTSAVVMTPLNMQWTSVSATGAASGIILANATSSGSPGGFRIVGDSGSTNNSSGGTIQNTTGDGISLSNVQNIFLDQLNIQTTAGSGINGVLSVNNFSFTNGTINNSGDAVTESNIAFNGTGSLSGNNINGTLTVTGSTLTNARDSGIYLENDAGTISDAVITGNTFTSTTSAATSLGDGIKLVGIGNTTTAANLTKATINNNTITNFPGGGGIQVNYGNTNSTGPRGEAGTPGNPTNIINIVSNTIQGQSAANRMNTSAILFVIGGGNSGQRSRGNANISCNGRFGGGCLASGPLTNLTGTVIGIGNNGFSDMTAVVDNNTIVANHQVAGLAANGIGGGNGVVIGCAAGRCETPDLTLTATNNTISQTDGNGILLVGRGNGTGAIAKLGIRNNSVSAPLSGFRPGIRVDAGNTAAGSDDAVCLDLRANTTSGSSSTAGIGLRKQGTVATTNDFGIEGMAATSSPGVEQYVGNGAGLNPGSANGIGDGSVNGVLQISATSGYSNCSSAPFGPQVGDDLNSHFFQSVPQENEPSGVQINTNPLIDEEIDIPFLKSPATRDERPSNAEISAAVQFVNSLVFANASYQPAFESFDLAVLEKQVANAKAYEGKATRESSPTAEQSSTVTAFLTELVSKLGSAISPTAHSQETTSDETNAQPESGETITVNGSGTGFVIPTGKSTTIIFRAVIGNTLPAFTTVSNQGSVSGNFPTVQTDDPDVAGSANPTVTNIDHTTVAVVSNLNPTTFGQSVTFTATMTGVPSRASDPPGTVQFKADGTNIGSPVAVVVGTVGDNVSTAQVSVSTLAVGTRVITAEYSGGGSGVTGYNANIGTLAGGQVVGKANTTTGLTSSQNPSVFGQQVTFTATVAPVLPGTGSPTGTINFLDGGVGIVGCQNVALASAQATCQTSALIVGSHTITTTYSGDASFNTSIGTMTGNPQVVNKANTTVALTSSQNPAPQGTTITFTAAVSVTPPGAGTRSGTVQFRDGVTPITGCTAVTLTANAAACMTNALTPGSHTISAVYSGDTNFNTSTGNLTGNPQVITGPPIITPTAGLTRIQGNPASNSVVATVSDDVSAPGAVTVIAQTVPTGMQVTGIVNTNGSIAASVRALCNATIGNNTIVLRATDAKGLAQDANLVINVQANPAPTLGNYANQTIVTSCKLTIAPDAVPADNQPLANVTATSATFTGTISVDPMSGVITASNSGPIAGSPHTVTVTATDSCGAMSVKNFTITVTAAPTAVADFDFDGDRKADISVYRAGATPSDPSTWFVLRSSDSTAQTPQFGVGEDRIVTADYNGDGTANFAVYRPSTGVWYTSLNPATNYDAFSWGASGDIPVPGRYDADNRADHAVFRPSTGRWWIARSTGGTEIRSWGVSTDLPVPADYDGDGLTDLAVYRPSTLSFHILRSTGGSVVQVFGVAGDKIVPADYDGDGKDDIAIWRPSTGVWWILQSSNGQVRQDRWGVNGDVPAPADYDNDGKADLSIFRPSDGRWWIFSSCPCMTLGSQWGIATDKPVPSAFTP